MSLLVAGLLASVSGAALGWLARRRALRVTARGQAGDGAGEPNDPAGATSEGAPALLDDAVFTGLPLRPGAVVVRAAGEEACITGAVLFDEAAVVAALYVAPQARGDVYLFATAAPEGEVQWLSAVSEVDEVASREPPLAVEVGGVRFERRRMRPLGAKTVGAGMEDVSGLVLVAEYDALSTQRLLVVRGETTRHTYVGEVLRPETYEIIAGSPDARDDGPR